MAEIPQVFDQTGAAFVLIRPGQKFPPIEEGWQSKPHAFAEAQAHAGRGGNVGIMAGNGYIGFDQDAPEAFEGLELPITTIWETRPGRLGMWFKVSESVAEALAGIGKKANQAQLKLFKDGKPCGEIKLQRTYQVIPNSWKTLEDGTRADYKILRESPPAEISLAKLLADLQAISITFSSKLEKNAARLEDIGAKARQRRTESDEQRTRHYVESALGDEVRAMERAPAGSRNEQLNKSAFALGQFVAAGVLSEAEVTRALSKAAMNGGLEIEEIRKTLASGLESGAKHPREIPAPENKASAHKEPGASSEVQENALLIMKHGDPVAYITGVFNRLHVGDTQLAKILLCSIASQSVLNGEGLQPKLSGDSGKGKTHACKALAHLIPHEWVLECSLSAKALFYYPDMKPGMIVFSDDLQLSEDLEGTLKRSMTNFQQRTKHLTLDSKRNVLALELPERLCWWLTSVNDEGDLQLLNRFLGVGIDDTIGQDANVTAWQLTRAENGELAFPEDEDVLICREIFRSFKEKTFKVSIPFARRINWLDSSDRRNLPRFLDLIRAFAVLRFMQREHKNGILRADIQDFKNAAALYQTRAENQISKLTDAELSLARWMAGKGELTLSDILGRHTKPSGKPYTRQGLMTLLHGKKGREGLLSKVPGLDYFQETTKDADSGRSIRRNVYVLTAFDMLASFGAVVSLKPDSGDDATDCNHGATHVQHDVVAYTNNNSSNNTVVDATNHKKMNSKEEKGGQSSASVESSSCFAEKVAPIHRTESEDIEKPGFEGQLHRGCSEVAPELHPGCTEKESLAGGAAQCQDLAAKVVPPDQIRIAALMEYGINGQVDPAQIAGKLHIPREEVVVWLQANYEAFERPNGGGIGYRQKRAWRPGE